MKGEAVDSRMSFGYYAKRQNKRGFVNEKEKAVLAAKTKVLKALAHPSRLWMVERLSVGECCVCKLVDGLGLDFSTVSKHLLVLKNAGVVVDDKRGKQVFYSLKVPCVLNFMHCVEAVIKGEGEGL
jgi:ArsR family transcriptional regulator